jgi:phosphoribosyl 1,2-cyclic phosphate phosphodiesterase
MRVTILGSGGSGGVPIADGTPGGNWGRCDPKNPRNRRRRVSVLVEDSGSTALVDTSPDLRDQLLDAKVRKLDAVFFTHAHADHVHGIDELRSLVRARGGPVDAYMDAATWGELKRRYPYIFASTCDPDSLYPPQLRDRLIETLGQPFRAGSLDVVAFNQVHGPEVTLGLRFGPVAYSTDVTELDEAAFRALAGVEVWIVDCLREEPHPTHANLAQALEWIARVKPKRAILTHLNHQADYETIRAKCPPGVEPGYDGMVIEAGAV